ncbi:hypothetical protein Tdes44962_MAKER06034 [Teratosphaeria destructans]|uniref:Uncharacterized protein n=1 Tax=Teratosphaeria destructans TaxID=418781 RepID=A0A9W7VXY1_9PEZI|nr:hypothetical protein Tdes44962_MAKER06034 [Teratosphaeria destructans]
MPSSSGLPSDATVVLRLRPKCGMKRLLRRLDLWCCDLGVRVPLSCVPSFCDPASEAKDWVSCLLLELMRKKFLIFWPVEWLCGALLLVFKARPLNPRFPPLSLVLPPSLLFSACGILGAVAVVMPCTVRILPVMAPGEVG